MWITLAFIVGLLLGWWTHVTLTRTVPPMVTPPTLEPPMHVRPLVMPPVAVAPVPPPAPRPPAPEQVMVVFTDADERSKGRTESLDAKLRRPTLYRFDRKYICSRQDAQGRWIYREVRH